MADIRPDDVILEPFHGYGSIPKQAVKQFAFRKMLCSDIDPGHVERLSGRLKNPEAAFSVADALNLHEIPSGSVDKIITFACFVIRMQNATWMAYALRSAVTLLLSGAVIPFDLLPWGIGSSLKLLPFGSLAAAPLSVFVGASAPGGVLPLQIFWRAVAAGSAGIQAEPRKDGVLWGIG